MLGYTQPTFYIPIDVGLHPTYILIEAPKIGGWGHFRLKFKSTKSQRRGIYSEQMKIEAQKKEMGSDLPHLLLAS